MNLSPEAALIGEPGAPGEGPQGPAAPAGRKRSLPEIIAFIGAFVLIVVYALPGGAYDIVVRQAYGLVVWWILAIGFALGLLPRARFSRSTLLLLGTLVAFGAWTALSLTWTESSGRTFAEVARVLDYVGLVTLVASALDRHTWRMAAAGLGFGALSICAVALASRLAPSTFPADVAARVFRADRLDYPFGYWNAAGAWGAMTAAFGLAWSTHDRSRVRRAIALALVPVACLTTYLTYSRAGVAAIALAVIAVLALSRNRLTAVLHTVVAAAGTGLAILTVRGEPEIARATGTHGASAVVGAVVVAGLLCGLVAFVTRATKLDRQRVPSRLARPVLGAGVLILVIAGVAFGPHIATRAWHSFRDTSAAATNTANPTARLSNLSGTRYNLWKVALDGFRARPAKGTGAGTYEFLWNRNALDLEFVRNAHSLWLENLAELGVPGLVLIIAVIGAALGVGVSVRRRARRSTTAGAAAAIVAVLLVYLLSASVDWMWQSTAVTVLALAGVAALSVRLGGGPVRLRWFARAGLVVAALVAAAIQVPGLLSTTEIRRSQTAERARNTPQALAWANASVSAEPWSAAAYEQRGLVLESQGRLRAAAADVERAISHERTNFATWILLARIQTERRLYPAALSDDRQAHRLRPTSAAFASASGSGAP